MPNLEGQRQDWLRQLAEAKSSGDVSRELGIERRLLRIDDHIAGRSIYEDVILPEDDSDALSF
jgi:hypothetical protein